MATSFRHAGRELLGREITDAEVLARWGAPLRERFAPLASSAPELMEHLIDAYVAHYETHHDRMALLFPGVYEMLASLRRLGCAMGVVTSKRRRSTMQALDAFHLHAFIRVAVTADDVAAAKPAPDPIREALRRLGGHPGAALMVGDGAVDILAARAAGVRSMAALWGAREVDALLAAGPDYVVDTPHDVVALVASRNVHGDD
ncbi:MAG: HAD family hydrolase [bacterium]